MTGEFEYLKKTLVHISEVRVLPVRHVFEGGLVEIRLISALASHVAFTSPILPAEQASQSKNDRHPSQVTKYHTVDT